VTTDVDAMNWSGNSGTVACDMNSSVRITAIASDGSTFANWSGCDSTNGNQCIVLMNAARSVTAKFTLNPIQYALTVARAGTGNGNVTSSPPGIDCGYVCSAKYAQGKTVSLTPLSHKGSIFTGWSGGGCMGSGPCITTMNTDMDVTATFTVQQGDPKIWVEPTSLNFGSLKTGSTSDPKTITINNKDTSPLIIQMKTISSEDAGDF